MANFWAGYRYFLFGEWIQWAGSNGVLTGELRRVGFLLVIPIFVLIISAQNIETGRLVGGGQKSNVYTLIVSIFNALFLAMVLWIDLTKPTSIIAEVRWELIWTTTVTLFNIIGLASLASNPPASNTCSGGSNSAWNICSSSGVMIALLVLSIIASAIHALMLVVLVVRQSGKTELSVWSFMAWKFTSTLDTTPSITTSLPSSRPQRPPRDDMVEVGLAGPKDLPPIPSSARPISLDDPAGPIPPPAAYGRRDPFTFTIRPAYSCRASACAEIL
ncbi:hypothetical protein BDV93DRAFT_346810 [Ceratobasidium sp. AG-I]|nr:hypothetical protein BDV93DRAFT_346810 [Ceratobasidium sp. AG-I]